MLLKTYMADRDRLLALPLVPENNSHSSNFKNNPPAPPPPPAPGVAGILTSSTSVVSKNVNKTDCNPCKLVSYLLHNETIAI